MSAIAKFAAGGKPMYKKDLGKMAMAYGNVYVAVVAMGAKDDQTLKAFIEAEAFDGPSIIIAYSHCIAHGIDMEAPLKQQVMAVDSGQWILYRYNPNRDKDGLNPLIIDSKKPKIPVADYMNSETRFKMVTKIKPKEAAVMYKMAQEFVDKRYAEFEYLASRTTDKTE